MNEKIQEILKDVLLLGGILTFHEESTFEEGENVLSEEVLGQIEDLVDRLDECLVEIETEALIPYARAELAAAMERLNKFIEREGENREV